MATGGGVHIVIAPNYPEAIAVGVAVGAVAAVVSVLRVSIELTPRDDGHAPSPSCDDIHCYIHNVDELGPGYTRCGECWHLYRTRRALVWAYRRVHLGMLCGGHVGLRDTGFRTGILPWVRMVVSARAERIWSCPQCSHDF